MQSWRHTPGLTAHAIVGISMILFGGVLVATACARLACLPLPAGVESLFQFALSDYFLPHPKDINVEAHMEECLGLLTIGIVQLVLGLLLIAPSTYPAAGPGQLILGCCPLPPHDARPSLSASGCVACFVVDRGVSVLPGNANSKSARRRIKSRLMALWPSSDRYHADLKPLSRLPVSAFSATVDPWALL